MAVPAPLSAFWSPQHHHRPAMPGRFVWPWRLDLLDLRQRLASGAITDDLPRLAAAVGARANALLGGSYVTRFINLNSY
jgi:hypothetical protein